MPKFRDNITSMKAYHPPLDGRTDTRDLLLDFNERTTPLPQVINDTLAEWCRRGRTQIYPEYPELLEQLSLYTARPNSELFFGNGSDQILDCVYRAVLEAEDEVLLPTPSFAMYRQCAELANSKVETYSLMTKDPWEALCTSMKKKPYKLAVVSQPNNPTGGIYDQKQLLDLVLSYPNTWFIVDEAYYEFSRKSILDHTGKEFPENLVVTRTFSKAFGLAALRIGYSISASNMVEQLGKIRGPYDVNHLAALAATLVLKHKDVVLNIVDEIMTHCKPKVEEALTNKGIAFLPSAANFLLITDKKVGDGKLFQDSEIRVRSMSQPELKGYCRLSIPDKESLGGLLKLIRSY